MKRRLKMFRVIFGWALYALLNPDGTANDMRYAYDRVRWIK